MLLCRTKERRGAEGLRLAWLSSSHTHQFGSPCLHLCEEPLALRVAHTGRQLLQENKEAVRDRVRNVVALQPQRRPNVPGGGAPLASARSDVHRDLIRADRRPASSARADAGSSASEVA